MRTFRQEQRGAAAVEFALLIPGMVLLIFAIMHLGMMAFSEVSLHWAVEEAARCAVMTEQYTTPPAGDAPVSCTTISQTQTYAGGLFKAPLVSSSFTATLLNPFGSKYCKQVTGQGNYAIHIWSVNLSVPLTATACYPTNATSWS